MSINIFSTIFFIKICHLRQPNRTIFWIVGKCFLIYSHFKNIFGYFRRFFVKNNFMPMACSFSSKCLRVKNGKILFVFISKNCFDDKERRKLIDMIFIALFYLHLITINTIIYGYWKMNKTNKGQHAVLVIQLQQIMTMQGSSQEDNHHHLHHQYNLQNPTPININTKINSQTNTYSVSKGLFVLFILLSIFSFE